MEIPEGFANVRYIFSASGAPDQMGYSIGCEPEVALTPTEIADRAFEQWQDVFLVLTSDMFVGYALEGTVATKTVGGEPTVGQHLERFAGTGTIGAPSCNVSVLVRKNTALGGRKNRGRVFVPPYNLDEDEISVSGALSGAYVFQQQGRWDLFFTALATADIPPVLFHSDPALAPTPITSFSVQTLAATQRRRMR